MIDDLEFESDGKDMRPNADISDAELVCETSPEPYTKILSPVESSGRPYDYVHRLAHGFLQMAKNESAQKIKTEVEKLPQKLQDIDLKDQHPGTTLHRMISDTAEKVQTKDRSKATECSPLPYHNYLEVVSKKIPALSSKAQVFLKTVTGNINRELRG